MANHCRKKSSSKHKQLKRRIVIIFNIKNEKFPQEVEEFYDEIEYESILWLGGFVKTTLSAALIGSGASVLLSGLCNYPFFLENPFLNSVIGLAGIIVGVLIVILIDLDRKRYKKKEIEYYATELQKLSVDIASQMIKHDIEELHEEISNLQEKGVKEDK